jgi:biotin transport system substrate-specific component
LGFFIAGLGASIVIHAAGILGLMLVAKLGFGAAFLLDLTFWPGDLAKMFVAAAIAVAVHKAFPALLVRRQPAIA